MYRFTALAVQSWALYAISISLIFSRLIFRRIMLGCYKKLQADDWVMMFLLLPYTASIVLANQVGTSQSAEERKFRYLLEEMQLVTLWLVKACLLVLYCRIFPVENSFAQRWTFGGVSAFCCLSFLIVQVSLMLWCRPTPAYWDMSTSNRNTMHVVPEPHRPDSCIRHTKRHPDHDPPGPLHPYTTPSPPCHTPHTEHSRARHWNRRASRDAPASYTPELPTVVHHRIHTKHYLRESTLPHILRRHCSASSHTSLLKPTCTPTMAAE